MAWGWCDARLRRIHQADFSSGLFRTGAMRDTYLLIIDESTPERRARMQTRLF